MKNFVFLYAGMDSTYVFDKVFSNNSAFGSSLAWAKKIPECEGIAIFTSLKNELMVKEEIDLGDLQNVQIIKKDKWFCADIIKEMSKIMSSVKSTNAIYSSADKVFLDINLTKEILECHEKYIAEYTFADGYPYGFSPEVIHSGTLNILSSFVDEKFLEEGSAEVSNECIFNLLKKDINSFEVEAVIAPKDYRLLRFDFSCEIKRNFVACKRLFNKAMENKLEMDAKTLSDFAEKCVEIQQTLPSFYNIQISSKMNSFPIYLPRKDFGKENMELEKFNQIMSQIEEFSDDGVVGIGAFGEPLLVENIDLYIQEIIKHKNLSVLIETDGVLVTEELAQRISKISNSKVIWIVSIDASSKEMYSKIFNNDLFEKAVSSISILEPLFPGNVYPQFTRMNENEDELESFYRYWHDNNSPSKGKLIIQKYDDCCKTLPNRKPADLSPLERNVCWHLKRDMTILCNGDVPLCKQFAFSSFIGNVFNEDIKEIWGKTIATVENHINGEYGEKCRDCDEYYTFNF